MGQTPASPDGGRSSYITVRAGILSGLCIVGGLTLSVMVLGSAPSALTISEAAADVPVETFPPVTPAVEVPVAAVAPLPVETAAAAEAVAEPVAAAAEPTVASPAAPVAAAPTPVAVVAAAMPQQVAPVAAPAPATAPAPAPVNAAPPAQVIAPAPAPVPVAVPTTRAPQPVPAAVVAPTTAVTTTVPNTVATTSPPPDSSTVTYPTYGLEGLADIILTFTNSSDLTVWSVTPESNWVYEIDKNGPRSVEIKFFNLKTHAEGEFHADVENGRIKVESAGGA